MRFIALFLLNLVCAAQFSIPAKAQTPLTGATFRTAKNYCLSLVLLFISSASNSALASTGCSAWSSSGVAMSAGQTVANSIGGFSEGDIITINFNNGNTNNVVKITALGSMSVVQWLGGTTTTVSYTVKASDVGSNISYELYGGANNNWNAEFECVYVSSVAVPSAGSYAAGDTLNFTIVTSENVTVDTSSGTPQLSLTIGTTIVQANYVSGSGTKNLSFDYIVQAGETDFDGISVGTLSSNGGSLILTAARYPSNMGLTLDNVGSTSSVLVNTIAPTLSSSSPADDASAVAVDANIVLTFSEAVDTETGTIVIKKVSDGSTVESFDVATSTAISGSGTTTITINPTSNLTGSTAYYIEIASIAFDDAAGNSYAGITGATTLNFETADVFAPTLSSSSPSDDATGVAVDANIVLTFSEAVDTETGTIVIKKVSDNTQVESFDVATSSAISGSGTTTITINPTSNLASSTAYYIEIASTAFDDAAGNSYAGITGATTLNFETADVAAPTLTFSPADGATGVAADANITITFNEAVRLIDDSALSDTNVDALITLKDTNSSGSNIAFDATVSGNVITINPTNEFSSEQTVYVAIGATVEDSSDNAITASNATFAVVQTNSPALDFAASETAIRTVLVDDMMRAVRSSLNASARMMSDVRGRLRGADGSLPTLSTRSVPLEIDGVASADAGTLSTRGTATASLTRHSGAYRRLFFSDFDIQHDLDTDNTTATLSARVAWEHMVADGTLLGYYVGAEASESDINGTFAGDQTRLGLNVGGYVAHRLAETLYTDAYVSLGVGHSELNMSNGTLALESDYRSETVTLGASISGSYDYTDYEFRPELAFNYGKTQIGTVFFTGRAYDLEDDTLSLNAGSVSIANVTLRPEVIYAIQNSPTANTNASLSFSPRLICERTMATRRTENCGSGGEVGYTAHSNDGLRDINFRITVDKVGSSRRSSAVLGVEMRF